MKVRVSYRASNHLFPAYEYLEALNPTAAGDQLKRIFDAIDVLERHPLAGRQGRVPGTRELAVPRSPFIVAYAVEDESIDILAVLHGRQRWPKSF